MPRRESTHDGRPATSVGLNRALLALLLLSAPETVRGQHGVAATLHNLSVSGPGEIRALNETEVCKFCHIPHSAVVPQPLWGHALSQVGDYAVASVSGGGGVRVPAPQPDGSSRLCLSCHDGTVALGDLGAGRPPITMAGAQRLGPGRPGFLGTDLSGSHPVSFVVAEGDPAATAGGRDMGVKPLQLIRADTGVRLDEAGKMQCTSCHDPHADRFYRAGKVPHFWVKPTVTEVCLTCHELR